MLLFKVIAMMLWARALAVSPITNDAFRSEIFVRSRCGDATVDRPRFKVDAVVSNRYIFHEF